MIRQRERERSREREREVKRETDRHTDTQTYTSHFLFLLAGALKTKDPLLLKLVRNLCSHEHSKVEIHLVAAAVVESFVSPANVCTMTGLAFHSLCR